MTFPQESERPATSTLEQVSDESAEILLVQPIEAADQHRGRNEADKHHISDVDALCEIMWTTETELRPTAPAPCILSNIATAQTNDASGEVGVTRSHKKERLTKRSSAKVYARPVKEVSTVTCSLKVIKADVII